MLLEENKHTNNALPLIIDEVAEIAENVINQNDMIVNTTSPNGSHNGQSKTNNTSPNTYTITMKRRRISNSFLPITSSNVIVVDENINNFKVGEDRNEISTIDNILINENTSSSNKNENDNIDLKIKNEEIKKKSHKKQIGRPRK